MNYPTYPAPVGEGWQGQLPQQPAMPPQQPSVPQGMPAHMPYMPQTPAQPMGYPPVYGAMYPQPQMMPPVAPYAPYGMPPQMMVPPQAAQMPLMTLDEAIKSYLEFKVSKGRDTKTLGDMELALRTLNFVRPDIQYVNQITKRLILEYEALVAEIPVNFRKSQRLRHMRFAELKVAAAGKPRLSPASIDKYVITLRSFIHWCQDTDRMPNWKLPRFEGLDKRNSKDKRHPFTKDELQKLFTSPMFTGHQPDRDRQLWRHRAGDLLVKDHFYWVPWIGLYSGMRLREIVQLELADIRQEGEVVYMDVNTEGAGKSLKNHASKRQVPVHPRLVELGFLDYVEAMRRQGQTRVFPRAKPTAAGSPSDLLSKQFGRYLKAIGIKHSKLSFHSLRHTFIDQAARQAKLPDHMIKALVGHADQTITFGTYGGRISIAELAEAQGKIAFTLN